MVPTVVIKIVPKNSSGSMASNSTVRTFSLSSILFNDSHLVSLPPMAPNASVPTLPPPPPRLVSLPPISKIPQERLEFNARYGLQDHTRMCRLLYPFPILGQRFSKEQKSPILRQMGLIFRYQCAGPAYNNFTTQHMIPFIQRKQQSQHSFWGRRPTIIPTSNNTQSTSILFIGNSHTRQVFNALMCQYQDQFLAKTNTYQRIFALSPSSSKLTISAVDNYPGLYSGRWKQNLEEEILNHKLEQVDAVVIGQFNIYSEEFARSALWKDMRRYDQQHPLVQLNLTGYPRALPLYDLGREYKGPIIFVPMFNADTEVLAAANKTLSDMKRLQQEGNRANLYYINSRDHVSEPEIQHKECPSDDSKFVTSCTGTSHRCLGENGSEADLVVYDLVEKLWEIFN